MYPLLIVMIQKRKEAEAKRAHDDEEDGEIRREEGEEEEEEAFDDSLMWNDFPSSMTLAATPPTHPAAPSTHVAEGLPKQHDINSLLQRTSVKPLQLATKAGAAGTKSVPKKSPRGSLVPSGAPPLDGAPPNVWPPRVAPPRKGAPESPPRRHNDVRVDRTRMADHTITQC